MALNAEKIEDMLIRASLGWSLEKAKAEGLVTNMEEEVSYVRMQKNCKEIIDKGGQIAIEGDCGWPDLD
jgi:predicted kinase